MSHATHADSAAPSRSAAPCPTPPATRGSACLDTHEQAFAYTMEDFAADSSRPPNFYCTRPGSAVLSSSGTVTGPIPRRFPGLTRRGHRSPRRRSAVS